MQRRQIRLVLPSDEYEALDALATEELRPDYEQVRLIVRDELRRRGFLVSPTPVSLGVGRLPAEALDVPS